MHFLLSSPSSCLLPTTLATPADAQEEASAAADNVGDLQQSLDAVLTELDIARSLLASQRQAEMRVLEQRAGGDHGGGGGQQLVAFPVRIGTLRFDPEVGGPRS